MAALVKHSVTFGAAPAGGNKFYFLAPADHYTGLEAETGVNKLSPTSDEQNMPITKLEELLKSPVMTRRTLRFKQAGKTRYAKIAIAANKAITFDTDGIGKSFKGSQILGISESLDAYYS